MECDSREYEILARAAASVRGVEGLTCEIGVRAGGGTQVILDALRESGQRKMHVAVDPFGNLDYLHHEDIVVHNSGYTNTIKRRMLKNLYALADATNQDVMFLALEDTEFFGRFSDGVPVYTEGTKRLVNSYALVHLDGPHSSSVARAEFDWFADRMPLGGVVVFDDVDQYPHIEVVDPHVTSRGFEIMERGGCKISYVKMVR